MQRFASFWTGDQLGFLERACLQSFVRADSAITLYTYNQALVGVPTGVVVMDAATILPLTPALQDILIRFPARFSDYFRLLMILKTQEIWVDCDVYYLNPVTYDKNLITVGRPAIPNPHIWNGVLFLDPNSALLADYIGLCQTAKIVCRPTWVMPVNSDRGFEPVTDFFARFDKVHLGADDLPRNFFGPILLSLLVSQYRPSGLIDPKVHYPFGAPKLRRNIHDPKGAALPVPRHAQTIHFFGSMVYNAVARYQIDPGTGQPDIPKGSLLWQAMTGQL